MIDKSSDDEYSHEETATGNKCELQVPRGKTRKEAPTAT
jgi:hypothetical protein